MFVLTWRQAIESFHECFYDRFIFGFIETIGSRGGIISFGPVVGLKHKGGMLDSLVEQDASTPVAIILVFKTIPGSKAVGRLTSGEH